jgi:peroxiredoxin
MKNTPCLAALGAATLALTLACGSPDSTDVALSSAPRVELSVTDFTLTDTAGQSHTLSDYIAEGKTVVLEWFNPMCPFVKGYHDTQPDRMAETYRKLADHDVVWLAINSGALGKQGAGQDLNAAAVAEWKLPYPVLLDMDGTIGRAFGAKTTPHMFIVAPEGQLIYNGAIDDSGGRGTPNTNYVLQACHELFNGLEVSMQKTKAFGCSVKYGN